MPSPSRILASLGSADVAVRFELVGKLGRVRSRKRRSGEKTYFLDLRPYGRVWAHRGIPIRDEATAQRLLEQIRGKLADGRALDEVLAAYLPEDAKPNLVATHLPRWLEIKRREVAAQDLSPTYHRELVRYARKDGEFSFLNAYSIHEISYAVLEDWSLWLADRGLAAKTRRNVMGGFRSFMGWLIKRGLIREIPEFPLPRVDEHEPRVLSIHDQDAILEAIPDYERGIFLALAHLGLRPGEARALDVADFRDGWLTVDKAAKGPGPEAEIRGTKTGKAKRLPTGGAVADWIVRNVDARDRLTQTPLFRNPRTGRRWSHWALRDRWIRAGKAVGIHDVRLYEGTKHTMATDAVRRGVSERALQTFLGHSDARSTRRYARMSEEAMISVLRDPGANGSSGLSPTCRPPDSGLAKLVELRRKVASPTGLEPVLPP
ncbi:MAG: tyrosine-type recombinase/integrase [bacterium]|nr:tyrosine-type recombinase/integrase [bacterium]